MPAPPVRYVRTPDGYDIAYTLSGSGFPLVVLPSWINHVRDVWAEGFSVGNLLRDASKTFQVVNYDSRGMGLSTRGLGEDFSFDSYLTDLESVLTRLGFQRFILLGFSSFSFLAVHYALRHPERVAALILIGPPFRWLSSVWEDLAKYDWEGFLAGSVSRTYSLPMARRVLEMFKRWATPEDYLISVRAWRNAGWERVSELQTPTLVLWSPGLRVDVDSVAEFTGRLPDGRLVLLESGLPYGGPGEAMQAIAPFLQEAGIDAVIGSEPLKPAADGLSDREVEVLRLIAKGKSNAEIAQQLTISRHTVIRHVSHILAKTGAANRTEAAGYAHGHGLTQDS
jgi:DNA-binding CsgD family transcriptional regulator/pimeloyl-ACP methyl ester carboxylesterase